MSIDRSLWVKGALVRHRNVLTRAERIQMLTERGEWTESSLPLGLPKVAHRKAKAGKKEAKTPAAAAEGAEGTPAAPAA